MACFSEAVKGVFKDAGQSKLCDELEADHAKLLER